MAQYEMNLRDCWLVVRRRRWVIVLCTVLTALLSVWLGKQRVPVYEATAAVKFEQSTSLSGLMVEVLSYSSADSIETQASLIRSYPILEEVARRMGKLPDAARGEAVRESKAYTATLDALGGQLRTSRVPATSIIEVTVTSANPTEARDLANTVAETYRDYNRAVRNARITEARKFIEAQLREVEARVKRSEDEVWAYREANGIISPGAESTVLVSLFTQIRGDIEKTRQQRSELEQAQARLARSDPASLGDRIFIDTANPAIQRLQSAQVELLLERNNLALEVTDKHPRLQAIDERMREVRAEMRRELAAQVALLRSREEILGRQMGDLLQRNRAVPSVELGLARLQRDAKVNDDLLTLLKTKHQEALIKESEGVEEVTVIRPATEPGAPVGKEAVNTVFVGALLGLVLGLVLAFVQETLDTSIGTIEDVESYLKVPVLGIVPHIDSRETLQAITTRRPALADTDPEALRTHALLVTHFDPKSPVAEAYRTLRTNLQFARMEHAGKALVMTSPTLQEGKTTTIVNLAVTMAQNGQRTLLVGANMRRPSIHRFFGIEREPGLSDILVGAVPWHDCIRTVADILMGRFDMDDVMATPGLDNLHIIESGPVPANPSELLSTPAMAAFLREVREEYDVVLIDTPPVLPVTDATIVAAQADGVILVYQAGKVGRLVLKRAKAHLEGGHAKVWGVVLNDVQAEIAGYAYTQYYTHYYGEESASDTPWTPFARARAALAARAARFRRQIAGTGTAEAGGTVVSEAIGADGTPPAEPPPSGAVPPRREGRRRRRYRNAGAGFLLLAALLVALGAAAAWRFSWLGSPRSSREILRQRLETPPRLPVPPTTPLAPRPATETNRTLEALSGMTSAEAVGTVPESSPPPAPSATASAPPTPTRASQFRARYAVEFGPFVSTGEADRVERQLSDSGYAIVRFRQQTGASLYAVLIERVPSAREAQALVATLREQGFEEAVVLGTADVLSVRVGEPLPLRGAVHLAERLRARGHQVRVLTQPGQAITFVIRHGNFASREEAEARGRELASLGLASQVIRVR